MANQIGKFFAPQGHETAVAGIADHLTKFWEVKEAVRRLGVNEVDEDGYSGDA